VTAHYAAGAASRAQGQVETGVDPIDGQGRWTAVRHLIVMVGIAAGDRQPDAGSLAEAPSSRQQRDDDFFRSAGNERRRVAAIAL
jgi:hypothetical protein